MGDTSTSATATACARPCVEAATATPASHRAPAQKLYLAAIIDPEYHYEARERPRPARATSNSPLCG